MTLLWFGAYCIALLGIGGLLAIKYYEYKMGRTLFLSEQRVHLSEYIIALEERLRDKFTLRYVMSIFASVSLTLTHTFARLTAKLAKWIEWRARSVAHKSARAKEGVESARENAFLREVQEHKESLDVSGVAEQSRL